MTKTLLVDVDGVLIDFTTEFLRIANRLAGTNYVHADVTQWNLQDLPGLPEHSKEIWKEVHRFGFAGSLLPYHGAQEGLEKLKELGDVYIVTSPLIPTMDAGPLDGQTFFFERVRSLWEHFRIPAKRIIFAEAKNLIRGDVFIDDKLLNVVNWSADHPYGMPVLWKQPYNEGQARPGMIHTNSWETLTWTIQKPFPVLPFPDIHLAVGPEEIDRILSEEGADQQLSSWAAEMIDGESK